MSNSRFGLRTRKGEVRGVVEKLSAATLLNNFLNASGAYSLRLLNNNYKGFCLTVRRSNDNQEKNIGFNSLGELDIDTLLSFAGVNSLFVTTWYDQSGNGLNVTQIIPANQPRIVDSGTLETLNGKIAIRFIAANSTFLSGGNILSIGNNSFVGYAVATAINNNSIYAKSVSAAASSRYGIITESGSTISIADAGNVDRGATINQVYNNQTLLLQQVVINDGNRLWINNSNVNTNTTSNNIAVGTRTTRFLIGAYSNSGDSGLNTSLNNNGFIQEVVLFINSGANLPNVVNLQLEVNKYYNIF